MCGRQLQSWLSASWWCGRQGRSHTRRWTKRRSLWRSRGRLLASRICWQLSLSTRTIMPQRSSLGDLSDAEPAAPHGFIVVLRLVPNVGRPRTEEDCGVTPSPSSRLLYVAKTWKKLKGFGQNFQSLSNTCSEAANLPTCGGAPA